MHVQRRASNRPFGAGFYDGTSGIPGLTSPTDKLWAHHMEAWHVPPAMLTSRNATDWHREPWRRPPTYTDDGLRPGDAPRHLFCVVRHPVCRVIAQFRSAFNRHSRGCGTACGLEEWLSDAHLNQVAGPFPRAVHGLAVVPWYSSSCDSVLRHERLQEDFSRLIARYAPQHARSSTLPYVSNADPSRDLRFNVTPRLLEKIGHAYAADMHHFGYSLDPAHIPCALHDDGEAARASGGDLDALARASERKERRLPPRSFRDRQKGGLGLRSRMRTLS